MSASDTLGSPGALLTFVLAGLAVAVLAYVASRALGSWHSVQTRGKRLRVLEGVPVGKDRQLWLVAVGKEVLVVGASAGGVQLVHRVEATEAAALLEREAEPALVPISPSFAQLETSVRSSLERIRQRLSATRENGHE